MSKATLHWNGQDYEFPVVVGTEGETGIDIGKLRAATGTITLDPGYVNTGSCQSSITYINGEEGILRYRGYSIEELADKASFEEVMYLLVWGRLPNAGELSEFNAKLSEHALVHEDVKKLLEGFPKDAHPMAVLTSLVAAAGSYESTSGNDDDDIIRLLAKLKSLAAYSYRYANGLPYQYPTKGLGYAADFANMMFADPTGESKVSPAVESALNKLLILHADHEQNCSASTVRMVGSSGATLYASIAAGVGALSGPLHGGANQAVIEMLEMIQQDSDGYQKYVDLAKDKESGFRLMGFGHRVYKNFDPRARILKKSADEVLETLGIQDPLLDIAKDLEKVALNDEFFVKRRLYPNVDFYSGIIYRALKIPTEMFTVMFALGRLPGWIAQWKEQSEDPAGRIYRPRQVYIGERSRTFVPVEKR